MSRVVVVLPTETYRATDFVEAARRLGVELAVASEHPLPLVPADRQVTIDCSDPETSADRVADLGATTPVDAIIAADDQGVEIASRAAELLGLPGNPVSAAQATLDKGIMRRSLAAAEVPQPSFAEAASPADAAEAAERLGFPVVVKPRTRRAGIGVVRADGRADVAAAFEAAHRHQHEDDGSDVVLVESFAPGDEISVEGLLWSGELEILAIFDKPDQPDGPVFPETIFVTPSSLEPETVAEVGRIVAEAVAAIGLTDGPIHAELRVHDGRPVVIEIAGRTIGGICGRSLSFGLMGDTLESLVVRQALGIRKRGFRRSGEATGVMMIPTPRRGMLDRIEGLDDARRVAGVTDIEITTPVGTEVVPVPDADGYLGFIFARGADRDQVIDALRTAHAHLDPVIT